MEELLYKYKIYFPLSCGISLRDIIQQDRTSVSVFIKTVIQAFYCLKMLHRLGYRLGLTTTILDGFIGNASDPSLKGFYIYMSDLSKCVSSSSDEDKQKDFDELRNEILKVRTDSERSHVLNYIYDRFSSNITSNKVHPLTRRVDREVQLVKEERSQLRVDESKDVERIEQPKVKENNIQLLKQQKLEQVERDNKKRINDALEQKNRRENAKQEEIKRQQEENERRAEMERQQAIQLQQVEIARQAELDEQEESHLRIMIQEAKNTIDRLGGDIQPIYNQLVERYRNNPLLYSIMEEEWKEVVIREKAMASELSLMTEQIELALQLIKKPTEGETDRQLNEIILGLRTRYGRNPVLLDRLNERWEDVVEKKKQMDVVYSQIQGVIQQAYQQVDQLGDPKPILSFLSKKYEGADINLSNYILQESENVIKYKNEMDQSISIIRKAVEEAIGVLKKGDTLATGGMDKVKQIIRGVRDRFMGNPLLQDLISTGFQEVEEEQRRLEEEHRQKLLLIQQAKEEEDARFQRLAAEKENAKSVERVGLVGSYVYEEKEETEKERKIRERDERQRTRALIDQQRKEERERIKQVEEDRKKLEQEQIRIQTVKLLQEQAEEDVRKKQLEAETKKKAEEYLARQSREQQRKQEEVERKEKLKAEEEAHRKQREENTRKQKEALKEQERQLKVQAEEREKQRMESIRIQEEAREKERALLEEEKKKKEEIRLEQARVFKEEQDRIEAEQALREAKRQAAKDKKIQLLKQEKLEQEERINQENLKKALEQIEKDKVSRAEELRIRQKEVDDARLINEELERQAEIDRVEKLRLEASERLKRLEEDEKKLKLFIDGELLKITKVEDYQVLLKEIVDYGDEEFVQKYYSQIEQQRRNDQNWIEKLGRSDFDYPSYAYFYDSNRVPSYIRNMFLKQWKEYKEIEQLRTFGERKRIEEEKQEQLRVEEARQEQLRTFGERKRIEKEKQEQLRVEEARQEAKKNYKKTIRQTVVDPETVEEKERKRKVAEDVLISKQLSELERMKDYTTVIPKILQLYKNNPDHPSVKKYIDDLYKKIREKLKIQDQLCVKYKYNSSYLDEYNKLLKMLDVLNVSGDRDKKVMIDKERLVNNCMEIVTIIRREDLISTIDYRFFEQYQTELEKIIEYEKFDNELGNLYMKFTTRDLPTLKQLGIFKKLFASVLSDDDRNLETVEDVWMDQIRRDVAKIRRVELDRNEFIRSLVGQLKTILGKTTTLQYNGGMNDPLLQNVKYVSNLLGRFLDILRDHVDEAEVVFEDFKEAVLNDPKLSSSIKSRLVEIVQYSVDLIEEDFMVVVDDD